MLNPVQVTDIETRWRPLSQTEAGVAEALITDAWDIVSTTVPGLGDYVAAETVTTATITRIVAQMVLRVMRNPDGYRSESIDDWTGVRDSARSTGELYLAEPERASLMPSYTGLGGMYVVSLGG